MTAQEIEKAIIELMLLDETISTKAIVLTMAQNAVMEEEILNGVQDDQAAAAT